MALNNLVSKIAAISSFFILSLQVQPIPFSTLEARNMEFNNLHADCNCDCIDGTAEDIVSTYAMKTNKNKLKGNDFKSHWEREKGRESVNCNEICSYKGKSVSIITPETENAVKNVFKGIFKIAPGYKSFFTTLKFKDNCGVVKFTPMQENPYHYDFYKCDAFDFTQVEFVNSTLLGD